LFDRIASYKKDLGIDKDKCDVVFKQTRQRFFDQIDAKKFSLKKNRDFFYKFKTPNKPFQLSLKGCQLTICVGDNSMQVLYNI